MAGAFGFGSLISQSDRVIYVQAGAQGGIGSLAKPFGSLAQALAEVPKILSHNWQIRVIGHINEPAILKGCSVLGSLLITGHNTGRDNNSIQRLEFVGVTGRTTVSNLTANTNSGQTAFYYDACSGYHLINDCSSEKPLPPAPISWTIGGNIDQGRGVMALYGSSVAVYNSHFAGRRYGVRVSYNGMCETRNCTGHNAIGYGVRFNGMISMYHGLSHMTGERANTSVQNGGLITDDSGRVIIGNDGVGW